MKSLRTIILMVTLVLCSMTSVAQIKAEFFGCTIGSTSKAEAIKKLNAQNLNVGSEGNWLVIRKVNYQGYNWGRISFKFESDVCTKIMFLEPLSISIIEKNGRDTEMLEMKRKYDRNYKETAFQDISNSLLKKYQKYLTSGKAEEQRYEFEDAKTKIIFSTYDDMNLILTFAVK